jgi:predicted membrane protein
LFVVTIKLTYEEANLFALARDHFSSRRSSVTTERHHVDPEIHPGLVRAAMYRTLTAPLVYVIAIGLSFFRTEVKPGKYVWAAFGSLALPWKPGHLRSAYA